MLFGKNRSKTEVLNDKDGDLINFYNIIQKHPDEFSRQARQIVISRRIYDLMKAQETGFLSDIERAVRFYYLLRIGFGGRIKNPNFGVSTTRMPKWNPDQFRLHFREIARRLEGVTIECMDYADLIERYDRPWTLFYCDPPYINAESVYCVAFSKQDHKHLASVLTAIKGRFILSYNDHPDAWKMYKKCNFRQVEGHYSISRQPDGRRSFGEVIITNFDPQAAN